MPTVTSLILTSDNLYDIEEKNKTLEETGKSHPIGKGEKGEFQGGRNFPGGVKFHTN